MTPAEKKLRVLHVIGNLRFGGAQVVVKQIAENSDPNLFEHSVYSLRPKPNEMSIRSEVIDHSRKPYDIRKFWDLIRICRERQIDIVHTHLYKSTLIGLLLTFFCGVRIVVHEHGSIFDSGLSGLIYPPLLRLLHKRAAVIIANSHSTRRGLEKHSCISEDRVQVIPNAADLARFQFDPEKRATLRRAYELSENDIVIGFIGRLHPVKGIDALVQAMPKLIAHNPAFRLLIVGNGPLEKSLRQQSNEKHLENHIQFLGYHEDVSEIMNAFDIGCMPSRMESFGIAAIEMMSMNVPLVCSCIDGLGEITEDRTTALHLDAITPDAIAEHIIELSDNETLRTVLRENAFAACRKYSIENFARAVDRVYRRIIPL